MAKKKTTITSRLDFVQIVMGADAEVIKAAYEARVKIDDLLTQRDEAYRRITDLENQVEAIVGEPGVYAFPPPPCDVAGMSKSPVKRRPPAPVDAPKVKAPSANSACAQATAPTATDTAATSENALSDDSNPSADVSTSADKATPSFQEHA